MTKEDLVNTVSQLDTIKKVLNRPVQVVCIIIKTLSVVILNLLCYSHQWRN